MTFLIISAGWQEQQQDRKDAAIPGKYCLLPRDYDTLPMREGRKMAQREKWSNLIQWKW